MKKSNLRTMRDQNVYFSSFSGAVQHACAEVERRGYELDQDDYAREVTFGPGKPAPGKTTRANIGLLKDGKVQRKALSIQVYNRETDYHQYELTFYVN